MTNKQNVKVVPDTKAMVLESPNKGDAKSGIALEVESVQEKQKTQVKEYQSEPITLNAKINSYLVNESSENIALFKHLTDAARILNDPYKSANEHIAARVTLFNVVMSILSVESGFSRLFEALLIFVGDESQDGCFRSTEIFQGYPFNELSEKENEQYGAIMHLLRTAANPNLQGKTNEYVSVSKITATGLSNLVTNRLITYFGS